MKAIENFEGFGLFWLNKWIILKKTLTLVIVKSDINFGKLNL